jgi:hypothetical protein
MSETNITNGTTPQPTQTTQPSTAEVKLTQEVNELRKQLLDPEYLNYLEAKQSGASRKAETPAATLLESDLKPEDIDKLPNSKLLRLAEATLGTKFVDSLRQEFNGEITGLRDTVQRLVAHIELQHVERKYPDFNEYRDGIVSLLSTTNKDMSIEDAYKMVKYDVLASKGDGDGEGESKPAAKQDAKGSEKPNQATPPPDLSSKEFKNEREAGAAAAKVIAEKYGLTSGTL